MAGHRLSKTREMRLKQKLIMRHKRALANTKEEIVSLKMHMKVEVKMVIKAKVSSQTKCLIKTCKEELTKIKILFSKK